jgi:hypothetical protein
MRTTATSTWRKLSVLLVIFCLTSATAASGQAAAQSSLAETANAAAISSVASRSVETQRRSDSLLNGALIGAGVGVATELFLCTRMEPWSVCRDDVGPMLTFGALGAGIGIALDALIRGRHSPSKGLADDSRLHAAAIVDRRSRGLQISLVF